MILYTSSMQLPSKMELLDPSMVLPGGEPVQSALQLSAGKITAASLTLDLRLAPCWCCARPPADRPHQPAIVRNTGAGTVLSLAAAPNAPLMRRIDRLSPRVGTLPLPFLRVHPVTGVRPDRSPHKRSWPLDQPLSHSQKDAVQYSSLNPASSSGTSDLTRTDPNGA